MTYMPESRPPDVDLRITWHSGDNYLAARDECDPGQDAELALTDRDVRSLRSIVGRLHAARACFQDRILSQKQDGFDAMQARLRYARRVKAKRSASTRLWLDEMDLELEAYYASRNGGVR